MLGFLFLLVCPCPNRGSGKGEAYFLPFPPFPYSWILNFSGLVAYLPDISDAWWLQVSCCGRSLFVHSSGVIIRPSQASLYVCSCLLPWCFSFASWGLHGFLLLRSSSVRLWCSLVGWYGHEVVDCVIHIGKTKSVVLRLHIIFSGDVIYNFPLQS